MSLTQVSRHAIDPRPDVASDFDELLQLLVTLDEQGYDFLAPTPASHARVLARPDRQVGSDVPDLLGWSIACKAGSELIDVVRTLDGAGLIDYRDDGLVKARVRVSRVFGNLFVHSSFPTEAQDSVFLGPDSHRFADYILRNMTGLPSPARILDYGAGAGVGGITAATDHGDAMLTLADINPAALALAAVNATHAGVAHETVMATTPAEVPGSFDLIVTHPPFMIDPDRRAYRDGGDLHGARLSLDWTLAGMAKLAPGGRLVMHTGVSIVDGRDVLLDALREAMPAIGYSYDYRLLDPDIFGDELDKEPYADVDRIAAIGLCVVRNPATAADHG
jgi:methylase of polypeptide subunit release factors